MYKFGYNYLYPIGAAVACCACVVVIKLSQYLAGRRIGQVFAALGVCSLEIMCCHECAIEFIHQLHHRSLAILDWQVWCINIAVTGILTWLVVIMKSKIKRQYE